MFSTFAHVTGAVVASLLKGIINFSKVPKISEAIKTLGDALAESFLETPLERFFGFFGDRKKNKRQAERIFKIYDEYKYKDKVEADKVEALVKSWFKEKKDKEVDDFVKKIRGDFEEAYKEATSVGDLINPDKMAEKFLGSEEFGWIRKDENYKSFEAFIQYLFERGPEVLLLELDPKDRCMLVCMSEAFRGILNERLEKNAEEIIGKAANAENESESNTADGKIKSQMNADFLSYGARYELAPVERAMSVVQRVCPYCGYSDEVSEIPIHFSYRENGVGQLYCPACGNTFDVLQSNPEMLKEFKTKVLNKIDILKEEGEEAKEEIVRAIFISTETIQEEVRENNNGIEAIIKQFKIFRKNYGNKIDKLLKTTENVQGGVEGISGKIEVIVNALKDIRELFLKGISVTEKSSQISKLVLHQVPCLYDTHKYHTIKIESNFDSVTVKHNEGKPSRAPSSCPSFTISNCKWSAVNGGGYILTKGQIDIPVYEANSDSFTLIASNISLSKTGWKVGELSSSEKGTTLPYIQDLKKPCIVLLRKGCDQPELSKTINGISYTDTYQACYYIQGRSTDETQGSKRSRKNCK